MLREPLAGPTPLHAVWAHPELVEPVGVVPPAALAQRLAAGYSTPSPPSPELAATAVPGWNLRQAG